MVGNAVMIVAQSLGFQVIGTSRRNNTDHYYLDLTWDLDKWPDLPDCDSLVICASANKLEDCQNDPVLSYAINVEGLEKVIKRYKSIQTKVLFFSSSHVFSGKKPLCGEDETLAPQNVLGKHKVLGEEMVLRAGGLVIRVTKVVDLNFPRYSEWAHNLKNGKQVKAFSNLMTSLVPLNSLVKVIIAAIHGKWSGIIHVSGPEDRSYSDIAGMLARGLECSDRLVHPVLGETEVIGRTHTHTTLHISDRVRALNLELPDTDTVIRRWCRNYMRTE